MWTTLPSTSTRSTWRSRRCARAVDRPWVDDFVLGLHVRPDAKALVDASRIASA
jgi:hypothetical protein